MARNSSGRYGEEAAVIFLKKRGWNILERNFHTRYGEIDIIAEHETFIVFVEVKTRLDDSLFLPREAVDIKKQSKLILTAKIYLSTHDIGTLQPRFDVIEVIAKKKRKFSIEEINLIENAFALQRGI